MPTFKEKLNIEREAIKREIQEIPLKTLSPLKAYMLGKLAGLDLAEKLEYAE